MEWFVLYVKSRAEKKVATRLQEKGVLVFCPTKIEERRWSDRIKKIEVPYFRSYVFVKFEEKEAAQILQTQGVVRRLFWLGKPAIIKEEEMQEVISFFDEHQNNNIVYVPFAKGEEVEIIKGTFRNQKGVVLTNDEHRVTLSIPALGYSFKVTLSKNKVGKTR